MKGLTNQPFVLLNLYNCPHIPIHNICYQSHIILHILIAKYQPYFIILPKPPTLYLHTTS